MEIQQPILTKQCCCDFYFYTKSGVVIELSACIGGGGGGVSEIVDVQMDACWTSPDRKLNKGQMRDRRGPSACVSMDSH